MQVNETLGWERRDVLSDVALNLATPASKRLLRRWNVYMHTTHKQKHSVPRGARGLILFWILSFPMALAAMVYALGIL
jgi:hypothetical protein